MKYDITDILGIILIILVCITVVFLGGILTYMAFVLHIIWGILMSLVDLMVILFLIIIFTDR